MEQRISKIKKCLQALDVCGTSWGSCHWCVCSAHVPFYCTCGYACMGDSEHVPKICITDERGWGLLSLIDAEQTVYCAPVTRQHFQMWKFWLVASCWHSSLRLYNTLNLGLSLQGCSASVEIEVQCQRKILVLIGRGLRVNTTFAGEIIPEGESLSLQA